MFSVTTTETGLRSSTSTRWYTKWETWTIITRITRCLYPARHPYTTDGVPCCAETTPNAGTNIRYGTALNKLLLHSANGTTSSGREGAPNNKPTLRTALFCNASSFVMACEWPPPVVLHPRTSSLCSCFYTPYHSNLSNLVTNGRVSATERKHKENAFREHGQVASFGEQKHPFIRSSISTT